MKKKGVDVHRFLGERSSVVRILAMILVLMLVPMHELLSQESINEIPDIKSTTSAQRVLDDGGWMVYCKDTSCRFVTAAYLHFLARHGNYTLSRLWT